MVPSDRMTVSVRKLKYRKFHFNIRKKNIFFLAVKVTKQWDRLLREVVESLSLDIFRT